LKLTIPATRRLVQLAAALDAAPAVVRQALAAVRISVEQAQVVAAAVAELPSAAGPEVADKAAAPLVEQADDFDPQVLRRLGERVLGHVHPSWPSMPSERLWRRPRCGRSGTGSSP
jgi:hypothetical protein